MRYDTEHKQRTRTKVLEAAAQAIRADGPERVGVAAVMAEAGLTHGGFYAHFKSKDELVAAAIDSMFEESRARLARETEGRGAKDGLAAYVDFYLSARHRDARGRGCPIAALASDAPRLSDNVRTAFAAGVARLTIGLTEKLAEAGAAEPQAAARSMVAELVGALTLARVETDPATSNAILRDSRALLKRRFGLEHVS
jgi:TetR/AcrR family transcriptional repressor of nem operon